MKKFEELTQKEIDVLRENDILFSIYPDVLISFDKEKKNKLLSFIPDLLSSLLYYDRKECEEVSVKDINYLTENNLISKDDLKKAFSEAIDKLSSIE